MITPQDEKIKYIFAFFCVFMQFLKMYEKSAIYNGIALLKTTKKMNTDVHKIEIMRKICIMQYTEVHTYIKMFVQTAKGKHKKAVMIFLLSPKYTKK